MQRPRLLNRVELAQFHSEEYIEFLERITPDRIEVSARSPILYTLGLVPYMSMSWSASRLTE